uniref:Peptidase C1A papain C-terminal domain-containing protein n=1 Tax=Salmo trutta TaxID=8032 RepID=A0A674AYX1_SALTR
IKTIYIHIYTYNKVFDMEEYYHRLQIFIENKRIDHHNEGNHKFTMGLNQFSDMTLLCSGLQQTWPWQTINIIYPGIILKEGTCKFKTDLAAAFVKDVVNITRYEEMGMLDAVARHNPVSLAYEVTSDFMHYHSGVYRSMECHNTTDTVNHAVLAVGYDEKGTPYFTNPRWIVKNSWGMKGYFLIERGKNICGLAACSSYPRPMP